MATNGKWAMGTEWGTGLITLSTYWLETYDKANEFIALYHYGKNPDIRNVWCQQEGCEDNRRPYTSSGDEQTERKRKQAAREYQTRNRD
jgi:hypothetical protein